MKRVVITAVLLSLLVVPSYAQTSACLGFQARPVTGQFTSPQEYTISWPALDGARAYSIEERVIEGPIPHGVLRTYTVDGTQTSITIRHEAINDVTYSYNIRTFGTVDCTAYTQPFRTFGDPVLRRAVRRGIVPVAGSTRGANGAVFKTSLRLEGPGLHGRVIFHPANRVASGDDPSIVYDTTMKSEWDDVVAAIGQSGVGSLSIVPDENDRGQLPKASIRLYNVASNGIFGANVEMYPALGFLDVNQPFQRIDVPADGSFRANVGARAILAGTARAIAVSADGLLKGTTDRSFAAGEVVFGSPDAVYGLHLDAGDSLIVTFSRAIVPFYTLTDNRTNDPFVYVQGADRNDLVDQYVK